MTVRSVATEEPSSATGADAAVSTVPSQAPPLHPVGAVVTEDPRSQLRALAETWPHVYSLIDEDRAFSHDTGGRR